SLAEDAVNDSIVAMGQGGNLTRLDRDTLEVLETYQLSSDVVQAVFSGDGHLLALLTRDGLVSVVDVAKPDDLLIQESVEGASAVALSTDGSIVAIAHETEVLLINLASGVQTPISGEWEDPEVQEEWIGHEDTITAVSFNRDGSLLVTGSKDTQIAFWDVETGKNRWMAMGHWSTVSTINSHDELDEMISGGEDFKARTWRVPGGKSTAQYEGHLATIVGVDYTSDEDLVVTTSEDGTLRIWDRANQRETDIYWSRYGLLPVWRNVIGIWLLISGLAGAVIMRGLSKVERWAYLAAMALFIIGPVVVFGASVLEVLTYSAAVAIKLRLIAPLLFMIAWYAVVDYLLLSEPISVMFEAPGAHGLAEILQVQQKTQKTRFAILSGAAWVGLLVILFSTLRRFNLDVAFMGHFFSFIMQGAGLTLGVSVASIVLAVLLAILGALGRLSSNPIANGLSSFYVSLIRGTPLLVQIYIWYLGLPRLGLTLPAVTAGVLALGVNYGAYMTEIFRAGIQAISKGQHEAAQALGMSRAQAFHRIILPQAFRIVIPPIGNDFIAMMKDSSLVSLMAVWELTFRANKIGRQNFRNMETYIIAAAFYWLLTVVFQALQGKLEERMARSERK
ncbi:MAG: ABC transporter permease subunit, partial [Chloroflexota bacterium]